jgi:biogenesis of lysosome-related organelles complex 1 subunit KXD1
MPTGKGPIYTTPQPRAADYTEMSDTATSYHSSRTSAGSYSIRSGSSSAGSHSGSDYERYTAAGIDVVDELSDRMNFAFDPIRMDKSLARQAQT